MLSKLANFPYDPLLVLQHNNDYLQCQNRYNMSVLPRMKLKNKNTDMWIGHDLAAGDLNVCSADSGGSTTYDPGGDYTKP